MVFLGGHPAKCWPPTICVQCVSVYVCVLLFLVFIIAVRLGNKVIFLPVITADTTGHGKFYNITQTILNPSVPEIRIFSKQQSPTVCNSCYSFTDRERVES